MADRNDIWGSIDRGLNSFFGPINRGLEAVGAAIPSGRLGDPGMLRREKDPLDRILEGETADDVYGSDSQGFLDNFMSSPQGQGVMLALGLLAPRAGGPSPRLKGMPETFKLPGGERVQSDPIPGVMAAHRDYMRRAGIDADMPQSFPAFDKERAARIAQAYDSAPHAPNDPGMQRAYRALADEVLGQYDALTRQGLRFKFMKPDGKGGFIDPYAASPSMGYKSLRDKGELEIFPTEGGFGSSAIPDLELNPMLAPSGRNFGGKPATVNDVFRAVHDAYGHFGTGNSFFRAPGEERAWVAHSSMFSPQARKALTAETRGQNSWVNYGPHGEANRTASGAQTVFAPQKTAPMPDWSVTEGMPSLPRASRDVELPRGLGLLPFSGHDVTSE